ncbi:adenylate cyclase [Acrasis kona]|uniref:Adenylate cyclase n=1 Tax=Acrasis kona TaxID=1008807 RepID=A0AAW2YXF5_9EUKA
MSGVGFARLFGYIPTLATSPGNPNNDQTTGLILGSFALFGIVSGFIVGFISMELYVWWLLRKTQRYGSHLSKSITVKQKDVDEMDVNTLDIALRLSIHQGEEYRTEIEKCVEVAALYGLESAQLCITRAIIATYVQRRAYGIATLMLKRANTFRPNILIKFIIFLRVKDLDEEIDEANTKKYIYKSIARGRKSQILMLQYVKLFWKAVVNVSSDGFTKEQYQKLSRLGHLAYSCERECDRIFTSLIESHPKDVGVLRAYAQYLERVKRDEYKAAVLYDEADEIEENENERAAVRRRLMAERELKASESTPTDPNPNNNLNPNNPNRLTREVQLSEVDIEMEEMPADTFQASRGPRSIVTDAPSIWSRKMSIQQPSLSGSRRRVDFMRGDFHGKMESSTSQNSDTNSEVRKQEAHRRQLLVKDHKWVIRVITGILPFLLIGFVIMAALVEEKHIRFLSTDYLLEACEMQSTTYGLLNDWRYYNLLDRTNPPARQRDLRDRMDIIQIKLQNSTRDMTDISYEGSTRRDVFFNQVNIVNVPSLDGTLNGTVNNMTLFDISQTIVRSLGDAEALPDSTFNTTTTNFGFMFLWLNQLTFESYYKNFCRTFWNDYISADSNKYAIISTIAAVGAFYHGIYFLLLLIPAMIILKRSRNRVIRVFEFVPKDVSGRIYRDLKMATKQDDKIHNLPWLTPIMLKLIVIISVIFLFELVCLAVVSYHSSLSVVCDKGASEIIYYVEDTLTNLYRINQLVQEILFPQPDLPLGLSDAIARVTIRTTTVRSSWNRARFGVGTINGKGLIGYSDYIDELINNGNCTVGLTIVSNYTLNATSGEMACMSLNELIDRLLTGSVSLINSANGMTQGDVLDRLSNNYYYARIGAEYLHNIALEYSRISQLSCSFPVDTFAIYGPLFVPIFLLFFPLVFYVNSYLSINHYIRNLLQPVPPETVSSVVQLDAFVNRFVTNFNKKMDSDGIKSRSLFSRKGDQKQAHAILEAANDGVILSNDRGVIMELNSSAKGMFGNLLESDVVGKNLGDLFVERQEMTNLLIDLTSIKRGLTKEFNGIKKNGEKFPCRVSTIFGKLGNANIIACFCTDVTVEHKQREYLSIEKLKNENLLLSILPAPVASRLKNGETNIADRIEDATCLFSDMVGFTKMSATMAASDLVKLLNEIVTLLDDRAEHNKIEKIKTIGDAYFCVGGLNGESNHPQNAVKFSIDALKAVRAVTGGRIDVRIGMHTGPIVAGVIGLTKFAYDCWGDTVNMASRMESTGIPGRVQISRSTFERVHDMFEFEERTDVNVKGKGIVNTYLLSMKHHLESPRYPNIEQTDFRRDTIFEEQVELRQGDEFNGVAVHVPTAHLEDDESDDDDDEEKDL